VGDDGKSAPAAHFIENSRHKSSKLLS